MKNKPELKSIANYILAAVGIAGLLTVAAIAPNSLQMLKVFGLDKKSYKKKSVYNALGRLQKQRLVEITEKGDETMIKITEAGKKRLLVYNLEEIQIEKPKKWDSRWRIIGFDVPEDKKRAREALRKKMRELGFIYLQKSFFVHPYDCRKEIEFVGEFFGIHKHILYVEAVAINNKIYEDYLKEQFGLA